MAREGITIATSVEEDDQTTRLKKYLQKYSDGMWEIQVVRAPSQEDLIGRVIIAQLHDPRKASTPNLPTFERYARELVVTCEPVFVYTGGLVVYDGTYLNGRNGRTLEGVEGIISFGNPGIITKKRGFERDIVGVLGRYLK